MPQNLAANLEGDAGPSWRRHFELDIDEPSLAEYHLRQPLECPRLARDL
jgi:hypothetical protein